jgi:hypothetical protein
MQPTPVTLSERLIAACLCALFAGITLLALPVAALVLTRGRGVTLLAASTHFHVWASIFVALFALYGFVSGSAKSTELLAHFWGTARPARFVLTLGLWLSIVGIALVTNLVLR